MYTFFRLDRTTYPDAHCVPNSIENVPFVLSPAVCFAMAVHGTMVMKIAVVSVQLSASCIGKEATKFMFRMS